MFDTKSSIRETPNLSTTCMMSIRLSGVQFPNSAGARSTLSVLSLPGGVTLPCREHCQVLVTKLLGAPLLGAK